VAHVDLRHPLPNPALSAPDLLRHISNHGLFRANLERIVWRPEPRKPSQARICWHETPALG